MAKPDAERKLRGGYYTPAAIADFLTRWAIQSRDAQVLEPSAGDGPVVVAAERHLDQSGRVVAVELVAEEAAKIAARTNSVTTVVNGEFFEWVGNPPSQPSFDAVVGNPPFIRYQDFDEEHRRRAFELMLTEGLHPTRLTNAWLPFVVVSTKLLRVGGRLALVLPAELMQVNYAAELRQYLAREFEQLTLVTFRKLVFKGVQQEVVLLLGTRGASDGADINVIELEGLEGLVTLQSDREPAATVNLDHASEKWTRFYLSRGELDVVRRVEESASFVPLENYASVDVGIVTGRNKFFVLSPREAQEKRLSEWCVPLVGRSAQVPGLKFGEADWRRLSDADERVLLLQLGDRDRKLLSRDALAYVAEGEGLGFHDGYKCRIRLPNWWSVPSDWVPSAFMLRQIHDAPRIVVNNSQATCTDTIHRLRIENPQTAERLAATSVTSVAAAFAEIRGRSYGGGVLELEPREAEALPTPAILRRAPLREIHDALRGGILEQAMDLADRTSLAGTDLSPTDLDVLRGAWHKLSTRRRKRRA